MCILSIFSCDSHFICFAHANFSLDSDIYGDNYVSKRQDDCHRKVTEYEIIKYLLRLLIVRYVHIIIKILRNQLLIYCFPGVSTYVEIKYQRPKDSRREIIKNFDVSFFFDCYELQVRLDSRCEKRYLRGFT